MAHAALPRRDAPEDERWPPFEYHGEEWIADLEQSWLVSLRNNLTDFLLARELPDVVPGGPRVASHRLSGSELYLHDLIDAIRVPWWRTFKDDLRDFWTSLRARVPDGPGLDISLASQHIRGLVPATHRSLAHSITVELRYLLTAQKLTPTERAAAKPPKYHPPLDILGIIVAISWQAVIIGVALAYSAIHPHAEAQIKTVKWPTTPIYFYPEPKPKEEVVSTARAPALPVPATPQPRQAVRRVLQSAPVMAAAPAPAPAVAAPKVADLNSMPALPLGLPATSVGAPTPPVLASSTGAGSGGTTVGVGVGGASGSGAGAGTGAASKAPDRIRISKVSPGSLLHDVQPVYPHAALIAHIQGDVVLRAVIAKDGSVKEVSLVRGHPVLVQSAIEAVRQRRYRPPTLNGAPVEVETEVTVSFVNNQ
jgi:protein TonB